MKLVTKRDVIENLVVAWENQFGSDPEKPQWKKVLIHLRAMDLATATEEQIAAIIGNRSWTRLECIECKQDCRTAIQLGQAFDAESQTAYLCPNCLRVALSELTSEPVALSRLALNPREAGGVPLMR